MITMLVFMCNDHYVERFKISKIYGIIHLYDEMNVETVQLIRLALVDLSWT